MSWTQIAEVDTTVEEVAGDIKIVEKLVEEVNKPKKLKAVKPKTEVLEEAQTIIYGDREKTYGHPEIEEQFNAVEDITR